MKIAHIIKCTLSAAILIVVCIAVAGAVKFNILNDDIYITEDGSSAISLHETHEENIRKLTSSPWRWVSTEYENETSITPLKPNYTLIFHDDGKISGQVDCNSMFSTYTLSGLHLSFGRIASTKVGCGPESQATDYTRTFQEVDNFFFNQEGNLVLLLKFDSGSMIFKKISE